MFLVIDPNVIFSALISHGHSSQVFALNAQKRKFDLIAPYFTYVELGKHLTEIAERSAFSLEEAQKDMEFIINQIRFVPEGEYKDKIEEARKILGEHEKDVPYLALALKYNCNIFSGDKTLKEILPERVKNPKEMLEELQ